ncbi:hypothetical protein NEIRO03_0424 [Nematocida sp. AWRm78]|nr:hypothetical protein NEIRO02_0332 [Nematocida sp. AWRm79]KAI5182773.1 hypothetical protein NEIRO03_0424 [Nematocida sp. AWRm78]
MHFIRYILLVLLYITNIKARMIWKDVEGFKRIVVGSYNGEERIVSLNNSLHPINLYVNNKLGLMYNLGTFGYDVDVKYKMEVTDSDSGDNIYKFSKTSDKNGIHGLDDNQRLSSDIWLKVHKCLIDMFPIVDGRATIYSEDEEYSFLAFLNNIPEKKNRFKLLASLFLLSEGVDIPFKIKKNKDDEYRLVIKPSKYSTKNYFITELNLENKNCKNKIDKNKPYYSLYGKYYHTQTKDIINFYNEIKDKNLEYKSKSTNLTRFLKYSSKSANLNTISAISTAKLLIQTYIFEYISNKKDMEEYLVETFNILKEHIEVIETQENLDYKEKLAFYVFNNIFCSVDQELLDIETKNIEKLSEVHSNINQCLFIPFHRELSMPDVLRTCYKSNELSLTGMSSSSMNISNPPKYFSPTNLEYLSSLDKFTIGTETSILTLLCCCLYDSHGMEYTLKKIENSPTELKLFFIKYRDLFDTEDLSVHHDWYKLINDLIIKNPSNSSLKGQYYNGGLLSMLSIILDITNGSEDTKKELNELIKKVKEEKNLSSELTADINNLINKILALLSYNKKMEVTTESDLRIDTLENHESDMFGKLHIRISTTSSIERELTIDFNFDKATAEYVDMNISKYDSVIKKCLDSMSCLLKNSMQNPIAINYKIADCILYNMNNLKSMLYEEEPPRFIKHFNSILHENKEFDPYQLFSYGRIIYTSDKRRIVECVSSIKCDKDDPNHLIGRSIIINVIGSMINFKTCAIDKVFSAIASNWEINCFNDNIIMNERVHSKLKPRVECVKLELKFDDDSDDDSDEYNKDYPIS